MAIRKKEEKTKINPFRQDEPFLRDELPRTKRAYYECARCLAYFYEENATPNLNMIHGPCGQVVKLLKFEADLALEDFRDAQSESIEEEYHEYLFVKKKIGKRRTFENGKV